MYALEAIRTRVSIRDYKPDPVPQELINTVIEAACRAPSGENLQPWRFVIVRNPTAKKMIGEVSVRGGARYFGPKNLELERRFAYIADPERRREVIDSLTEGSQFKFIGEAPVLIAVCADMSASPEMHVYDASAATENILLAAHSLGLGACWTRVGAIYSDDQDEIRRLLELPSHVYIHAIVTLGFPARVPRPRPRKELKEVAFYEHYGQTSPT